MPAGFLAPSASIGNPNYTWNTPQAQQQNNVMALQQSYNQTLQDQQGKYGNQQAQIGANASMHNADAAAGANRYGADTQYKALQSQLGQSQGRYNQIFPMFQQALNQGPSAAGGSTGAVGNYGYGTAAPPAPGGGGGGGLPKAVPDAQLQANINQNNAQNWQQAAGQTRRQNQQLAGGGLGAGSPLAKALQSQVFGSALQANASGATDARMQAAQLNSQQALGAYQSDNTANANMYGSRAAQAASQYGSNLDYQAALAGVAQNRQNAILAALASFVS